MVVEAGSSVLLVGHSERRHLFGETDDQVARKTAGALRNGVTPLVCIGETLAEREAGRTEHVVLRQLSAVLERVEAGGWDRIVLAYEPVWAIGTGKNATPDDAAQVHELIRFELTRRGIAGRVPILYGGSVNAGNVLALLARPELDGVLVGGASLDPDGWAELVGLGG
jgi:triosephosphate isomerase (TIM)